MRKPSFLTRARAALKVFRSGYPEGSKSLPWSWPSWRQLQPQWHLTDFETYVDEGFNMNSLVYSAIMFKVRATITAPLRAYTGDPYYPQTLEPGHPLAKLVARPNQHQSWAEFQSLNTVYLSLDGNAYVYKTSNQELYPLRPDRMYIVPTRGKKASLDYYMYVPEGKSFHDGYPLLSEDVIHIKLPNPGDPLEGMGYGLSPLGSAATSADVDNKVTSFLDVFFQSGTMLAGTLSYDIPLKENIVDEILDRWKKKYGGSQKWGEVGVLDRGAKYQRLGLTIEEMGFSELDARNETRILGPFGVPPILIGARVGIEHGTYSNYEGARKAVWEDTLLPELKLFEAEYQNHLTAPDAFVKFDISGVPALQKDLPILVNSAYTLYQMRVPANQALAAVGLRIGDVPGGDLIPELQSGRGQGQGPRADDEDDSWGMRSLDCRDCGGNLKLLEGPSTARLKILQCTHCYQLCALSENGDSLEVLEHERDSLLPQGL